MVIMGLSWTTVLKVRNNTDKVINEVKFIYNVDQSIISVKNIKPNDNKQTGISTLDEVKNLRMVVDGLEKEFLIKEEIPKAYMGSFTISINDINSDECKFEIKKD